MFVLSSTIHWNSSNKVESMPNHSLKENNHLIDKLEFPLFSLKVLNKIKSDQLKIIK